MTSTNPAPLTHDAPTWRQAGLRYHTYNHALRERFGQAVHKVSVDAGFTCPNVDGTVTTGGCVFCDNRSFSPSRRLPRQGVASQIAEGKRRLGRRFTARQYIAYFQPATNTYAPVPKLKALYDEALDQPDIVGLAIGTRPDCVPDPVLDLCQQLAERTFLSVEYGAQSMHRRSLDWMNRGHDHEAMVDAVERSRGRGFEICAHAILGIPGESVDDMLATARELARLNVDAVKLHNLYVVRNTPLADMYARGEVQMLERDQYVDALVGFLELLPPHCIVERIGGDAPQDYFVAPAWCLDKPGLRRAIENEFERRESWQGRAYQPPV